MNGSNTLQKKACISLLVGMSVLTLSACVEDLTENPATEEQLVDEAVTVTGDCHDGLDNDADTWIDEDDPDCQLTGSQTETGVGETSCNDGIDNDADLLVDGNDPECSNAEDGSEDITQGDIIISEFMPNPATVSDTDGEWFEIYNNTQGDIDLLGWSFEDASGVHIVEQSLVLPAKSFMVLARAAAELNGLPFTDYVYGSDLYFGNTGDDIRIISPQSEIIHSITYTGADVYAGASVIVNGGLFSQGDVDPVEASQPGNWCVSLEGWHADSDTGSPGSINETCL